MPSKQKVLAVSGLLSGAVTWGLVWYPLRLLEKEGVSGELTTFLMFGIALLLGIFFFHKTLRQLPPSKTILILIAITAGWTNLAYAIAVIHGEVMRVLLLFYLSPLWTVLLSRMILGERLNRHGYTVLALSFSGAMVMLWSSVNGLPLPQNSAEWFGLSAGMMFALSNVLTRKAHYHDIYLKSLSVFAGVSIIAIMPPLFQPDMLSPLLILSASSWGILLGLGLLAFLATVTVQFGLTHTPSNQAIVIFLFELVVAAISAYYLAGEKMMLREWVGGAMIITASLFSGKLEQKDV
ncbi:DMT family transporter [Sulfurirhabdus autotrophica]|uniref:EamA domain-containing membrane protein RarD n=1 Tax=Sulfurirhabdus autotrophica TaxID=1706046 RepID=A0A4R3YGR7_9PROT|nr:DMT family transporter [Sulfurirhabdus autotrophica]TCV90144.1 EamA domain-containing membrane protein RarD [Sulfurirhabdus autotrophica]